MKRNHSKRIALLLAAALLLLALLTACGPAEPTETDAEPAVQTAPPALTLTAGEQTLLLTPRTYEWNYDNSDGTSTGVNADACHPLDALSELETVDAAAAGGAVEIVLEDGMTVTDVNWWDQAETDLANQQPGAGELIAGEPAVYRIPVESGRVYELRMDFGASGNSFYAFAVN
ncbi:MAG: hypothetical protein IK116_08130 [Firmicutes bacterium]|nr:hypothetical protein [Bacillota bacterium]